MVWDLSEERSESFGERDDVRNCCRASVPVEELHYQRSCGRPLTLFFCIRNVPLPYSSSFIFTFSWVFSYKKKKKKKTSRSRGQLHLRPDEVLKAIYKASDMTEPRDSGERCSRCRKCRSRDGIDTWSVPLPAQVHYHAGENCS